MAVRVFLELSIKPQTARRRGRFIATAVFAAILTTFTAVCSVEIIMQAWQESPRPGATECRPGVLGLIRAVRRARDAAGRAPGGERESLARFRAALEPEWSARPALDLACAKDSEAGQSLGEVDRLRYAEEHALRYEAVDVASRRLRVDALERNLETP